MVNKVGVRVLPVYVGGACLIADSGFVLGVGCMLVLAVAEIFN